MHFSKSRLSSARLFAPLTACAAAALLAGAAEPDLPPSLTLPALVVESLEKNPELKFYDAEIAAAKAGRKTAGLLANPQLNGAMRLLPPRRRCFALGDG